jgi:hypothetical protein
MRLFFGLLHFAAWLYRVVGHANYGTRREHHSMEDTIFRHL